MGKKRNLLRECEWALDPHGGRRGRGGRWGERGRRGVGGLHASKEVRDDDVLCQAGMQAAVTHVRR